MSRNRLIGVVLTLVFLGLAFYRVNVDELIGALRSANYALLVPAALCTLLGYVLRAYRWRSILSQSVHIGFPTLFGILMIGFATNNLVPARLGELARAYLGRRRTGLRKTFFIATIFLERVFDGLVLILILFALSTRLPLPEWGREVQLASTVLFFGLAGGIALVVTRQQLAAAILRRAAGGLPERIGFWISSAFEMFLMGLESMRRIQRVGTVALLSCTIWLLEGLSYYLLALGFDLPLSPLRLVAAVCLLLVMVNLGIMIPSAPGYVGTFQFFAVSALSVFDVPRETGLALAVVSHVMQYALVTVIGLYFLGRQNIKLTTLFQTERASEEIALPPASRGVQ
ncbi:MAG: lysylphosphatidylglycerol synthase transmembrane domain-containing protein [Chloroflexota bacterium]